MTIEEAIKHLSWLHFDEVGELTQPKTWYGGIGGKRNEALLTAIRGLEAWKKVKEEIREMPTISLNANDVYKAEVLQIIDKHLSGVSP